MFSAGSKKASEKGESEEKRIFLMFSAGSKKASEKGESEEKRIFLMFSAGSKKWPLKENEVPEFNGSA